MTSERLTRDELVAERDARMGVSVEVYRRQCVSLERQVAELRAALVLYEGHHNMSHPDCDSTALRKARAALGASPEKTDD